LKDKQIEGVSKRPISDFEKNEKRRLKIQGAEFDVAFTADILRVLKQKVIDVDLNTL